MKSWRPLAVVLVGTLAVLAACSSSKSTTSATTSTTAASASSSTTAAPTSTSAPAAASATVAVATNAKLGTQIVVNPSGKTVYMYMPDGASTTSKVPAAIKSVWPAVTASGAPTAGSGLDQTKLAVQPQPDGSQQVSYNGHLLYTFTGDSAPGDANGERLGNIWFALSPAGEKIP